MDMKEQIQEYVAPDLSEFDKSLAVMTEDMKIVKETVGVFKEEIIIIRDSVNDSVDMMRDTKHDLRDEIIRTEKLLEKVENDIDKLEDEATALMDRTKKETRDAIDDANNRFNDKVSGMEGYVKRELGALEEDLNRKLQKSLDNPLANRNN
jgi:dsDNA-specific endonuclease/ATPase MutS2